jgi:hypothetical protein
MHPHIHHEAIGLHEQMTRASEDLCAPIRSSRTALLRRRDCVALQDGGTRSRFTSVRGANRFSSRGVHPFPRACHRPWWTYVPSGWPTGNVRGERPPGAPTAHTGHDGMHDLAPLCGARTTPWRRRRTQRSQDAPFGIGEITGRGSAVHDGFRVEWASLHSMERNLMTIGLCLLHAPTGHTPS